MKQTFSTFGSKYAPRPSRRRSGINSLWLWLLPALLTVLLGACRDEDFINLPSAPDNETRGELLKMDNPGGLTQNQDGTWSTNNCRVPLVGPGRVVNQIYTAFVSALGGNTGVGNVTDTDLDNEMSFGAGTAGVEVLYQPVISVRDLYRTYAPGQEVGFIYTGSSSTGVLTLNLLQGMNVELYKDGDLQEKKEVGDDGKVLGLDLLTVGSKGKVKERVLSFTATKPFDEVRLCMTGVGVDALKSGALSVKYAFVGAYPEIRATREDNPLFNSFWTGGKPEVNKTYELLGTKMSSWSPGILGIGAGYTIEKLDNLVDEDIDNSAKADFGLLSGLDGDHYTTVNFKREIPAGYEVGYKYSTAELLGIKLLTTNSPKLIAYDASNEKTGEESQISGNLVSVSLLGGEDHVSVSMALEKPCSQLKIHMDNGLIKDLLKLSTMYFHYAYVRQGVSLDPSSYFTFPDDTTYTDGYRLPSLPSEGKSLQYVVVSQPYGVNAQTVQNGGEWSLTGATKEGVYRVQALYTAPDGKQLSQIANIYRVMRSPKEGCNLYITVDSHGAYATETEEDIEWNGCLLCLFNGSNNANAVVDKDPNNYAVRRGLLGLIQSEPMIAIQMNKPVSPNGKRIRTGFIVQANNGLLNLDLLTNYTIRLYRSGVKVGEATGGKGGLLDLGLISDEEGKVRVSMETEEDFDHIELWCNKLLGLNLSDQLRIYNVFYEDASCSDELISETCMEVMSDVHHGVWIDYEDIIKGVSVGASLDGLGYLLDSDLETGMKVKGVLEAIGGGFEVPLVFNKMPAGQPIGIVLDGGSSLLGLDVLSNIKLKVYNGGYDQANWVADISDFDLIDVDLLTKKGRSYLEVMPPKEFDRIKIVINRGLLDLGLLDLDNLKITGLYTRRDTDGDGIPDCSETTEETAVELTEGARTCEGSDLVVHATTEAEVGTLYLLECKNQTTGKTYEKEIELGSDSEGKYFSIPDLPKGKYLISVYALGSGECLWNGASATVHPLLTEWTGATSTDWNNWDNWTEGSPWECTDVIIPSGVSQYPEIVSGDRCQNIHFEEGAAALHTHNLSYGKAFVDMRVKGGSYAYLSAPLQEMVTGDMFINPSVQWGKDNYFTVMNGNNYKESRTNPMVFQRIWGGTREDAYELPAEGEGVSVEITGTGWSEDFNAVTMKYRAGEGFSLRAGKEGDRGSYRFRFPKAGYGSAGSGKDEYSYFNENGTSVVRKESFNRNMQAVGRLFGDKDGKVTVKLQADKGAYFLVGNPYMSYISTSKFMEDNGITELRLYDGNTNRTLLAQGGKLLASDSELPAVIAPMQSVLVRKAGTEKELKLTFTPDMQVQPSVTSGRSRVAADNGLRIIARRGGYTASCLFRLSASASNGYRVGEDAEILLDSEVHPTVDVFTVADGKAMSIQQAKDVSRVPLGIYLRKPGDVTLTFIPEGMEASGWVLEDIRTGHAYSMEELLDGVTFAGMDSQTGRLVLVKK